MNQPSPGSPLRQGPHRSLEIQDERDRFLLDLFDRLWVVYRERMPPVRIFERLTAERGANFTNDHIAFRAMTFQKPALGLFTLSRIFTALGYTPAGSYDFPDKHLNAIHLQHPRPGYPKIFISELKTWELSTPSRRLIGRYLRAHRPLFGEDDLSALREPLRCGASRDNLLARTLRVFQSLPWPVPRKKDVLALYRESQYGAWTLVNGYGVNHFTGAVDTEGPGNFNDIEKVSAALRAAGVSMKKEIEGAPGSQLRQTSTESVVAPVNMKEGARRVAVPWTYAYFEMAERPFLTDPATGRRQRFEGFLGAQATHLFEMTRLPKQL